MRATRSSSRWSDYRQNYTMTPAVSSMAGHSTQRTADRNGDKPRSRPQNAGTTARSMVIPRRGTPAQ
eukprot:6326678-Amphidinium_carterae.1